MMRPRAIRALLLDVAGLRDPARDDATALEGHQRHALDRAQRRALMVVLVDAAALIVLFLFRDRDAAFLPLGRSEESVMTLGILAVAVHLGFRLAQLLVYRNVARKLDELPEEIS